MDSIPYLFPEGFWSSKRYYLFNFFFFSGGAGPQASSGPSPRGCSFSTFKISLLNGATLPFLYLDLFIPDLSGGLNPSFPHPFSGKFRISEIFFQSRPGAARFFLTSFPSCPICPFLEVLKVIRSLPSVSSRKRFVPFKFPPFGCFKGFLPVSQRRRFCLSTDGHPPPSEALSRSMCSWVFFRCDIPCSFEPLPFRLT